MSTVSHETIHTTAQAHMCPAMVSALAVLVSAWLFSAALASCSSIDCPVENTVFTTYTLENPDGSTGSMTTDTLTIKTLRSNGTDSTLINSLTGSDINGFDLPISYTQPEDILYTTLRCASGTTYLDTIRIKKENHPHFESVDCQATYFHTITAISTTHHGIDSIVINKPYVSYDSSTEHFHLYLKADR